MKLVKPICTGPTVPMDIKHATSENTRQVDLGQAQSQICFFKCVIVPKE